MFLPEMKDRLSAFYLREDGWLITTIYQSKPGQVPPHEIQVCNEKNPDWIPRCVEFE